VAKLRKRREVAGAGLTSRMACKWLGIIDQTCWRIRSARVRRTRRAVGVGPVGVSCCVACEINLRSCLRLEENRAGRSRGLPGVYVFAVSSLRPPPRPRPIVRAMRLRATARALTRQRINARNEGVRGSSPRVGFNADLTSVRVGNRLKRALVPGVYCSAALGTTAHVTTAPAATSAGAAIVPSEERPGATRTRGVRRAGQSRRRIKYRAAPKYRAIPRC
jgi:hypothetical protein